MTGHRPGDQVTVLPPYHNDPLIVTHQHYAVVAEVTAEGEIVVVIENTLPRWSRFGPFPPARIAAGWKDERGRWR